MTVAAAPDAVRALIADPAVARLMAALDVEGDETRIVGGAVRNALLARPRGDIDLATTAPPQAVMQRARKAGFKPVPTGIDHGTVTVVVDGTPFEVTTLREDVDTDGRRATVRFGRDFDADGRRRDFTINALSVDAAGRLHDPVGGMADIEARRVRFIGDPGMRIREDYLRTLRFFRFHADYGEGAIDAAGLSATIAGREGLLRLSRERVRSEMLKMLAARRAVETLRVFADAGHLSLVTGGVGYHGRFGRAAACRGAADAVLRLAALCVATIEDAERLRERLRLSNAEHARLVALARLVAVLHGRDDPLDRTGLRRLAVQHGLDAVAGALAIVAGEPNPRLTVDAEAMLAHWRAGRDGVPVFPLTGADAIAAGIPKGPDVGAVLARAQDLWLDADCPLDKATLQAILARAVAATGKRDQ